MPFSTIDGVPHSLLTRVFWFEVPPGVVGEVLRAAVLLPAPRDVERVEVEDRDAAGPVGAVGPAQTGEIDAVRAAVQRVRSGVAGLRRELGGVDGLVQRRLRRVGEGVEDVDVRRTQTRQQQEPALQTVHRVALVRQGAAARVVSDVVQLVAAGRQLAPPDHAGVAVRCRAHVDRGEGRRSRRSGRMRRRTRAAPAARPSPRRAAVEGRVDCGLLLLARRPCRSVGYSPSLRGAGCGAPAATPARLQMAAGPGEDLADAFLGRLAVVDGGGTGRCCVAGLERLHYAPLYVDEPL